jgi:hypothetical protein
VQNQIGNDRTIGEGSTIEEALASLMIELVGAGVVQGEWIKRIIEGGE